MDLPKSLETKLNNLKSFLSNRKVIVAFSGGVDSSLLAFISHKYAKQVLLVTEKSILYPEEEIEETRKFSESFGIEHMIIERNPLNNEQFQCNPKNRCYICKTGLYSEITLLDMMATMLKVLSRLLKCLHLKVLLSPMSLHALPGTVFQGPVV